MTEARVLGLLVLAGANLLIPGILAIAALVVAVVKSRVTRGKSQ